MPFHVTADIWVDEANPTPLIRIPPNEYTTRVVDPSKFKVDTFCSPLAGRILFNLLQNIVFHLRDNTENSTTRTNKVTDNKAISVRYRACAILACTLFPFVPGRCTRSFAGALVQFIRSSSEMSCRYVGSYFGGTPDEL